MHQLRSTLSKTKLLTTNYSRVQIAIKTIILIQSVKREYELAIDIVLDILYLKKNILYLFGYLVI